MHAAATKPSTARPLLAHAVNAERMHAAVTSTHAEGLQRGYKAGFLAGARWGRLVSFGWGCMVGVSLVAGALELGLLAGGK